MRRLFVIATAVVVGLGCASMAGLEPVATSRDQRVRYDRGVGVLVSRGAQSEVEIEPQRAPYERGERLAFKVRITNHTGAELDLSERNISVVVDGSAGRVVSAAEMAAEIRSQAKWAHFSNALGAAGRSMEAANAGQQTTFGTVQATAYGSGGWAHANGTYSETTYDEGAKRRAQEEANRVTQEQAAAISAQEQAQLDEVASVVLQRTTLGSEQSVAGVVVIETRPRKTATSSVVLTVNVGDDSHELAFTEARI